MTNCFRLAAIVWFFLLHFAGRALADDSPLVVLSLVGSNVDVQLNGMTEGLSAGSKIRFRNDTGKSYKGLLVKTSCGCLRPLGVDGIDVDSGSERELEFSFVPTAGSYQQACTITGLDESDIRRDLITLIFKGRVDTPVTLERRSILPTEVEKGSFTTGVKAIPDVEVDFAQIKSSESWLSVSGDAKASTLRLSWARKPESNQANLSVPLKWRGNSYRFNIVIDFINEFVSVVPSQMIFRTRESQKFVVARTILQSHGAELLPETIVLCSAEDHSEISVDGERVELLMRSITRSKVLVEWRIQSELVDRFRNKQVVFKIGEFFSCPMTCMYLEKGTAK